MFFNENSWIDSEKKSEIGLFANLNCLDKMKRDYSKLKRHITNGGEYTKT